MPKYNINEYSDNYSKTSASLWQYYRDDPTSADGNRKNVDIAVPLKYLRNLCRTLEMPLINYEIDLILT